MSTELDRAWAQINAIGGARDNHDLFDAGYDCALSHALQVIERLGGKDPLVRAAEERADPVIDWPRPSWDRKDRGLRFGGGLKLASVPTLMDDDEPDNAA